MRNWSSEVDLFLQQIDGPREKTGFVPPSKIKSPGWELQVIPSQHISFAAVAVDWWLECLGQVNLCASCV